MGELIAFYVLAAVAVIASLGVVGQKNPMHSVLWLIASFGALAGLYVLLDSPSQPGRLRMCARTSGQERWSALLEHGTAGPL